MVQTLEARIVQANTKDESLKLTIEAAELALRAVQMAATKAQQNEMKTRAAELLRTAEALKKSTSTGSHLEETRPLPLRQRTPVSIGRGSSSASSISDVFTTSSSGPYMRLGSTSSLSTLSTGKSRIPRSQREVTRSEQILLMRGSKVHGSKFPPWVAVPSEQDFVLQEGSPLFS